MKPATSAFLEKSRTLLAHADTMLGVALFDEAGRTAYLAGYHSAQALIFERSDKVMKTHRGVQSEFARLAKDDPHFDLELRAFLGRTYQLKSMADYEIGLNAQVTQAQAQHAIGAARRFLEAIQIRIGPQRDFV